MKTEALRKPDMPAVIERTHITPGLRGFLLPVFEALSNCLHSIEQRFGEENIREGRITIAFVHPNDPANLLISVEDNGIGLDERNFESFLTPFSGLKLQKRGRGFGRFIAFKVFDRIHYQSRDGDGEPLRTRTFRFNIYDKREIIFFEGEPDFSGTGVKVEFDEPKPDWHDTIKELGLDVIADELAEHFLPEFLRGKLPQITLLYGAESSDLNSRFSSLFNPKAAGTIDVQIDGQSERLDYTLSTIPRTRRFSQNALMFSAGGRIVGTPRDLGQKLGRPYFVDENDGKYVIVAVVSGEPFEKRLNDARTSINITPKEVEGVVSAIAEVIEGAESDQIAKIKSAQKEELASALIENPILRMGLRGETLEDYVRQKPNSWGADQFVSDLALKRYRFSEDISESISKVSEDEDAYISEIKGIVEALDEQKKDALAEYVVHRKKVIKLIEVARKFDADSKIAPEETIHNLIFRRFSDSTDSGYFYHNLWVVDDLLAFCPYISSDRTIHGGRRAAGDKVTDLLFYDDSMILGEDDGSSLVIVEFKKPARNDYAFGPAKSDPVTQVVETLQKALTAGSVQKKDGEIFSFSGVTRRFAYIIADITPTLTKVLRSHDFRNDWNPKIWHRYRGTEEMAIFVYGYDTMLENAKKRNAAFFQVLFGD
jgi:hypothetical protein